MKRALLNLPLHPTPLGYQKKKNNDQIWAPYCNAIIF